MRLVGRLLLGLVALAFAVTASTLFLTATALADPAFGRLTADLGAAGWHALFVSLVMLDDPAAAAGAVHALATAAAAILLVPPLFTALLGEVAGLRSPLWYMGAAGSVTAALPWLTRAGDRTPSGPELHLTLLLFLTGAIAGAVYWAIAGRRPLNAPASSGS